LLIICTSATSQ